MTEVNTGETKSDVAAQTGGDNPDAADAATATISELEVLKSRARMMNITFSNNIGVDALRQKISDKLEGKEDDMPKSDQLDDELLNAPVSPINPLETQVPQAVEQKRVPTLREWLYEENMRLIRCRITNLNPNKKDLPGEIITVANEYLGTVRKFVPFGEYTDEGFHIPKILYEELKTRRFLHITTTRDRRTGTMKVNQRWAPEFALEVMPPLTQEELTNLAQAQIAAGSVDSGDQL